MHMCTYLRKPDIKVIRPYFALGKMKKTRSYPRQSEAEN